MSKYKKCKTCNEHKLIEEFGNRTASKDGKKFKCLLCEKIHRRDRYLQDKDRISEENRKGHKVRKNKYYSVILEYLGTSTYTCSNCSYSHKYHAPFDWHHLDPTTKKHEVSSMVRHSKDKIIAELNKCILLCSNCHRILHYEED